MADRAVLWDLDGVVVDTGEYHYQAWDEVLAEVGLPFSRQFFQATFGMNNAGILTTLLGHEPPADQLTLISERKEERFRQIIHGQVRPLPGVIQSLQWFRRHGFKQAIASSAPPANIDFLIDELGLRDYFEAIVSGYDLPGKPAPDVFLLAARRLAVDPIACLVIEDAVAGVEGAKRANMKCLAVTTTNPIEKLQKADRVVDTLTVVSAAVINDLFSLTVEER
ncbi:MAG: HAD family phosphatase [Chloroflexi bacterium]|nr:HAD family phosphatase [Chloroflexota bacterium]